jgi:N-methylhydantoinase A
LPAHFSALGMLMADVRQDYVRTYYRRLVEADYAQLREIYAELLVAGNATLEDASVAAAARSFQYSMDLRYVGQEFWLQIPVTEAELAAGDGAAIQERFTQIHDHRFGHAAPDEPLELVNLRLTAIGARPRITFPKLEARGGNGAQIGTRAIHLDSPVQPTTCAVYRRDRLAPLTTIEGPAVIEEYASTTVVFHGDRVTVAATGELIVTVRRGEA